MLNDISRTPTFEHDWKRLRRKHYDSAKLRKAIQTLMAEDADTLIHTYRDHSLKGEWAGFRELHIEGDWLLIYRIDHGELCLVLTRTGNALMRGRGEFRVKLPKEKKPAAAKQYAALAEDVDEKLFDALRDVRTRLAARAGVPPYVIFSNATLADMAAKQPSSEFDLLSVRGVGDAKARRYGKEFLTAIQKYRDENLGK